MKPEEDALVAEKMKEQYERLEATKNIKFDENFTGFAKSDLVVARRGSSSSKWQGKSSGYGVERGRINRDLKSVTPINKRLDSSIQESISLQKSNK